MARATTQWDTVAIIGVGLIGGSIGLAIRDRGVARRVVGVGRTAARLKRAERLGAITAWTTNIEDGVADAQFVIVCTPVENIVDHVRQVASACQQKALITDAGSTKRRIASSLQQGLPGTASFIGSHPLAGSDQSGVEHACADLLDNRFVVVTPTSKTNQAELSELTRFWKALGAHVLTMSPRQHDAGLAATSHVPHVVAAALAKATPEGLLNLAASGWADTTRIASGDAELWQQILLDNRKDVLKSLDRFDKVLSAFRKAIEDDSKGKLKRLLDQGKQRRDALGS